tara:strand:- start:114 stop:398 length:285 start_codon:yes stop_codon:yes gene_type:complete
MIADKVFNRLKDYLGSNKTIVSFDPMGPQEFFNKDVDAFGNVKYSQEFSQKDLLKEQLIELENTANKLLAEEKYELLQELKEIYAKIKTDYDKL